jgi:hypothetical protein
MKKGPTLAFSVPLCQESIYWNWITPLYMPIEQV